MELQNGTTNASTNMLSNNCRFSDAFSSDENVIQIVAFVAILVLSLVGNIMIICVVLRKKLRKTNDLFLMNMAISDLIFPLMILPREITVYYTKDATWPFDDVWGDLSCKMYAFLENVSPSVSVLTLICMTIDRFCAIVFPTKINMLSSRTREIMVFSTWVIGSAVNSPYLCFMRVIKGAEGDNECIHEWSSSPSVSYQANNIYTIFNLLLNFIIPMAVLTLLYSVICVKLKAKNEAHSSDMARRRLQTARRVTVMTIIIVGLFGVLWSPFFTIMLLLAFYWKWNLPPICSWPRIMLTVRFLTFSHAAVNPFVCFIFIEKYRRQITVAVERARGVTASFIELKRVVVPSSRSFTLVDLNEIQVLERSGETFHTSRTDFIQ